MKRGEIWWAELPPPVGRRPVLLLSRNAAYQVRLAVTVAEITSVIRDIPVEVPLDVGDGMPKKCVVNLDTVITVPKSCIVKFITALQPGKMAEAEAALRFALDLR
ncbi:MAG: type II toxin-antitoxin system PemK/MazF family toxin [Candidatus Wallbacteria bacterium]|nr:type II toxin-antitoxin system PemK/MazF family toxin [Candidatus Wallbacteria bacterium]